MKLNRREKLFDATRKAVGISMGQVMPKWMIAVMCILFPSRLKAIVGLWCYDPATDTLNLNGVKLPMNETCQLLGRTSPQGHWFRVKDIDRHGYPLLERRIDGYGSGEGREV